MSHASDDAFELNVRDLLERVWRARHRIALFQLLTMLATLFVILFWPRTYSSEAKIFLQRGRESVGLDPTATTGKTIALQQAGRDAEIKSAIDVLSSRGIIESTVEELTPDVVLGNVTVGEAKSTAIGDGIKYAIGSVVNLIRSIDPASDHERAVVAIEKNLVVDSQRKSEIISVIYEADTPELAQTVVAKLVERYKRKHSDLHRTSGSTAFFDEQSKRLRNELQEASTQLKEAKNEIGLASIPEQRGILENRLGDVRQKLMDNAKELNASLARGKNLGSQLEKQPVRLARAETTKRNSPEDLQEQSLYNLRLRLIDAQSNFTESHPQVRSLKQQYAEAKSAMDDQQANRVEKVADLNPVHEALTLADSQNKAAIAALVASRNNLENQEADILKEIRQLNEHTIEIEQLERDVMLTSNKYITYSENLEEARVDQELHANSISSVNIAQKATRQEKPVAPSKPLVAICGILLAMAGSIAIAFLSAQFDDRITTQNMARKALGVPVLGVLPNARRHARIPV